MHFVMQNLKNAQICIYSLAGLNVGHYVELTFLKFFTCIVLKHFQKFLKIWTTAFSSSVYFIGAWVKGYKDMPSVFFACRERWLNGAVLQRKPQKPRLCCDTLAR